MLVDRQLIDYVPNVIKEMTEIKTILITEQPECEETWRAVQDALNDQFIDDSTERGVSRREKILKIIPNANEDIEFRKFRILLRWNEQSPYTITTLRQRLDLLCGDDNYALNVHNEKYLVDIKINTTQQSKYHEIVSFLRNIMPANMGIGSCLFMKSEPALIHVGAYHAIANHIKVHPYLPTPIQVTNKTFIRSLVKTGQKLIIRRREG